MYLEHHSKVVDKKFIKNHKLSDWDYEIDTKVNFEKKVVKTVKKTKKDWWNIFTNSIFFPNIL